MKRAALVVLTLCIAAACAAMRFSHCDANTQDRESIAASSSAQHWAGTDDLGRDRATRIAAAMLLGFCGAATVAAAATAITVAVALSIAFGHAAWSQAMLYVSDLFLTLPWLFLLMLLRAALPLDLSATTCALVTLLLLAALGWPVYVRGVCARLTAMRDAEWLMYARASGVSTLRMALRYLLPHLRPLYLAQFLLCVPACILGEADLGAIGFGMSDPLVSWGTLLKDLGSAAAVTTPWAYLPMGLLMVMLLCFEVLSLED